MIKSILKKNLPENVVKLLINFRTKYFDHFAVKSYSQEGEDMILRRMFEGQIAGFYIDVGAHHPKRFSNTYFFYKKGWNGINIDAMPGSMKPFEKIRTKDINIEKAISSKKQILTYYVFNEPALSGFSKEISERRNGLNNYKIVSKTEIETSTLEEVLEKNLPEKQVIDFLSVDVEGLDFDVIKSLNLNRYHPRVILVETSERTLSDVQNTEVYKYLSDQDYELYAKAVYTLIFKSKSF